MRIENDFRVPAPIERAWELLTDIPAIAPCLPGAELTGHEGDVYEGRMTVKLGPVTADYAGTATIVERDEANRRVRLSANGRDSRGSGNASAEITAVMEPDGDGTRILLETDLKIAGRIAQFGRGVLSEVSTTLIGQFSDCVGRKLDPAAGPAGGSSDDDPGEVPQQPSEPAADPLDLLAVARGPVMRRVALSVVVVAVVAAMWRLLRRRGA